MGAHFLEGLRLRFPRLQEVSLTESDKDEYTVEYTPAGPVETVYFSEREDFENAVAALAYKLEPRPIPRSMGAIYLDGIADHVKLEKAAFVILSRGGYSGITSSDLKYAYTKYGHRVIGADTSGNTNAKACAAADISDEKWDELSLSIRKNHELAHFVQRKLFPENKDTLKDEIKADMVGIAETFGVYDGFLARLFMGIEGPDYRSGGRLENYISESDDLAAACLAAEAYISSLEGQFCTGYKNITGCYDTRYQNGTGFDILMRVEESERDSNLFQ